ncbi:hypothetical protein LTR22_022755 [Elasticomyces elasticus]|nr:hypothetical protein LTR22_022755 [Elasticomyces elasticus]KAK4907369.1 hypothetical protein LTR49_023605 [Elasticomyces elasticus]KAK5740070.1 hypothetical protein LTS12_025049 [Elasticomyces elasticus]
MDASVVHKRRDQIGKYQKARLELSSNKHRGRHGWVGSSRESSYARSCLSGGSGQGLWCVVARDFSNGLLTTSTANDLVKHLDTLSSTKVSSPDVHPAYSRTQHDRPKKKSKRFVIVNQHRSRKAALSDAARRAGKVIDDRTNQHLTDETWKQGLTQACIAWANRGKRMVRGAEKEHR